MNSSDQPAGGAALGSLDVALAHAMRMLPRRPDLAAQQAEEILAAVPDSPHARQILVQALRAQGAYEPALEQARLLVDRQPRAAAARYELGLTLSQLGRVDEAAAALREAVALKPDWPDAWRVLADQLDAAGDGAGADAARGRFLTVAVRDPRLRAAATALQANDLSRAEPLLREHLAEHETDIAALRMLAELAMRLRRYRDAEELLARCIALAPSFLPAVHQYAMALFRQAKAAQALPHVERLLAHDADSLGYLTLMAAIRAHLGETAESIDLYETVLRRVPAQPQLWVSLGNALRTAGRTAESIDAYRRAIALAPGMGEAWWSLANLKTFRFDEADRRAMRAARERKDLSADDRLQLEYALGKALEDEGDYAGSFTHYAQGAQLRREAKPYSAEENTDFVRRSKALLTAGFFAQREGWGDPSADPIFILGMPRAGSTLLEQILASHPLVEGTMELPNLPNLVWELADPREGQRRYPDVLAQVTREQAAELGARYLRETRVQRKGGAPHFIDKLPNNFLYAGFLHLILPRARIIDARRHPMACCFSNFKQHFARGQNFSYSLEDLGRFYRDYVELMAHLDAVLPGRIHRVIYEELVEDTPGQVRSVLDYCGLEFDERCLRFYENERAVRTPSSEQVRQPIYRSGMDHWIHFDPWLGPLREALGPVLTQYPAVPAFP